MGKPVVIIGVGVVFAAVAGFMTLSYLKNQKAEQIHVAVEKVSVVVAADTISRGQVVDQDVVKMVEWPADSVPDGAFVSLENALGKLARSEIFVDDVLTQAKFLDTKAPSVLSMLIPSGRRAISIKVNEVTGISGFVAPGSHVDILLTVPAEDESPARTRVILQDTEVLAIAQSIENRDSRPVIVNTVTLNVSPRQAEVVTLATNEGHLHLVLRNDRDYDKVWSGGTSIYEVMGGVTSTHIGAAVELIRGVERTNATF
jgi:pilus assembly protein CpaB